MLLLLAVVPFAPAQAAAAQSDATSASSDVIVLWKSGRVSSFSVGKTLMAEHGHKVKETMYGNAGVLVDTGGRDAEVVAAEIAELPQVAAAQPNGEIHVSSDWTPNDPKYSEQWAYSHIQGPAAWGVTTGSSAITVAVLDTGADLTHPDLAANLVTGYNIITPAATADDDSTGEVAGHGTHVSGIIAAVSNNSVGVAGTAPGVRIMPIKVMDANGEGDSWDVVKGIEYAVDHGADVINMSLGGNDGSEQSVLQAAVDDAVKAGVVVVAASGNEYTGTLDYPAACTGVIAVGATTRTDIRETYSNYGPGMDVMAPGSYIYSTLNSSAGYGYMSGTSMASPFVAGAAALLLSHKPTATVAQVTAALENTAKDIGITGYDTLTGYGIIQMSAALYSLDDTTPPVTTSDMLAAYDDTATITLSATDASSGVAATYYSIDGGTVHSGTKITVTGYNDRHSIAYHSVDAAGNIETTTTKTFKIGDTLPPVTTSNKVASYSGSATIKLTASDGTGSGVVSTWYSLDGAAATEGTSVATDSMGPHQLAFRSVDVVGTAEATKTVSFTVWGVPVVGRVSGVDRYATAAAASAAAFNAAGTVVIASGEDYPDGLSAAGLAAGLDAPVLLTARDSLPQSTRTEIIRLKATEAIIVGGSSAVSPGVKTTIEAMTGVSVTRVSGADRYATSAKVADKVASLGSVNEAIVVRGDSFADSLSASAIAAARKIPILLTRSTVLPSATAVELQSLGVSEVIIGGGTSAVSSSVLDSIDAITGVSVHRVSGSDRYATSAALASYAVTEGWVSPARVAVSSGLSFPDALSGGAATGYQSGVLLLSAPSSLSSAASGFITSHGFNHMPVTVYGGTSAVSSVVGSQLTALRF